MATEIESIYTKIKSSNGVTVDCINPPPGSVYFATIRNKPNGRFEYIIWRVWCWCQLYAPLIYRLIGWVGKQTKWADSKFRDFETRVWDGNAFAQHALENGAAFAVVDNPRKHRPPQTILVEDATQTLYDVARYHRKHIDVPIVGITGSVGKTTTTHLTNRILSQKFKTTFTQGSNSAIGNSLNLLNAPADVELIVFEMSAIRRGFLNAACDIIRPTHGLITNTGMAHLNTFGSLENVRIGKWELLDNVDRAGGTVFLNMNHEWLASQAGRVKSPIRFGSQPDNDIVGSILSADPFIKIRWQFNGSDNFIDIQTKLAGEHNLDNLLGGIAIGVHFGVSPVEIVEAIKSFEPVEGRSQMFMWGSNTIYNEGFQCNVPSTLANLKSFKSFSAERKMLILESVSLIQRDHPVHEEIIDLVESMHLDQVVIIGEPYFRFKPKNVGVHLRNRAELRDWLLENPIQNTHIMLNVTGFMKIRKLLDEISAV